MLKRTHCWPDGHWDWPIHVSHKHGIRCGQMMFVGGQVDLDSHGTVLHVGDMRTQTANVVRHIGTVLEGLGADLTDLVALTAFFCSDGRQSEQDLLADIGRHLPSGTGPVITLVPLPALAYPGMMIEIEAIAMRSEVGERLRRQACQLSNMKPLPKPFSHGLRVGQMIFTSGISALDPAGTVVHSEDVVGQSEWVMQRIGDVLASFGATHDDGVKINTFYTGGGRFEDWEGAALARAHYFTEPGPAATGVPIPGHVDPSIRTRTTMMAMLGEDGRRLPRRHVWPEGHWDWPIHLPYKHGVKCGPMIFMGGQVSLTPKGEVIDPGKMVPQTRTAMANIGKILDGFGAKLDDVVKILTYYTGGASATQLHENLAVRSSCFTEPGPATTGIPFPFLAYDQMLIEIDSIAMAE